MTLAFGAIWIFFGSNFWILPLVFAGLIPSIRGGVRLFTNRSLPRRKSRTLADNRTETLERLVLTAAKNERGRVTPAKVTLNSDISLEKAQQILEDLVKRGYAGMEVRDNGTVEYVFPEFMP